MYVQSSEMEEKYVRFHRVHIQKYVDGNKRIITTKTQRNEFPFYNLYHIRARDVEPLNL